MLFLFILILPLTFNIWHGICHMTDKVSYVTEHEKHSPVGGNTLHCFNFSVGSSERVDVDGESQIVLLYIQIK